MQEKQKSRTDYLPFISGLLALMMWMIAGDIINAQPRIVGGEEATPHEYTFMAFVDTPGGACGGTYLKEGWVQTAEHCVSNDAKLETTVRLGAHNRHTDGQEFPVIGIVLHPTEDVAMLRIDTAGMITSTNIKPLGIDNIVSQTAGISATVIGWGNTREQGLKSDVLMEVSVPIRIQAECIARYGPVSKGEFCAGWDDGLMDSCGGDSGGPILQKEKDGWKLVGSVSRGFGCARPGWYGVYASAEYNQEWIEGVMAGNVIDEGPELIQVPETRGEEVVPEQEEVMYRIMLPIVQR